MRNDEKRTTDIGEKSMTPPTPTPELILPRMIRLREEMLAVSGMLKKAGYIDHGAEMFGAAKILKTWIVGIEKEMGNDN